MQKEKAPDRPVNKTFSAVSAKWPAHCAATGRHGAELSRRQREREVAGQAATAHRCPLLPWQLAPAACLQRSAWGAKRRGLTCSARAPARELLHMERKSCSHKRQPALLAGRDTRGYTEVSSFLWSVFRQPARWERISPLAITKVWTHSAWAENILYALPSLVCPCFKSFLVSGAGASDRITKGEQCHRADRCARSLSPRAMGAKIQGSARGEGVTNFQHSHFQDSANTAVGGEDMQWQLGFTESKKQQVSTRRKRTGCPKDKIQPPVSPLVVKC